MTDTSDRRFATTLARGLSILRAFRPTDAGLGNQEISERTGIPRPTVSRLTFTLCALGYLTHGRKHDKYRLGPAALALGNIAAASFSFVETASPDLQKLADDTGTLIGIAIHDAGRMLLTKTWRPVGSASIWLEVGYRLPMLTSSTGKAYLSAVTDAEFGQLVTMLTDRQEATYENPPRGPGECGQATAGHRLCPRSPRQALFPATSTASRSPTARTNSAARWCSSAGPPTTT